MSILCQKAFSKSVFFNMGLTPPPHFWTKLKKCRIAGERHPSPHYLFPFQGDSTMITARNWRENLNFSFCRCFLYVWHFCNFEFYLPRPAEGRTKIMELWSCSQVIRGFHAIAIHRIKGSSSRQQSITTISNIVVLIEEIPCCCCFGVDLCTIIWYLY